MSDVDRVRPDQHPGAPAKRLSLKQLLRMKSTPVVRGDEITDAAAILREQRASGKGRRLVAPARTGSAIVARYSGHGKSYSVRLAGKKFDRRPTVRTASMENARNAVSDAMVVRNGVAAGRLRELRSTRKAARLIDEGLSAPQLADALGLSVTEAERLRRRRALLSTEVSPEEIILRRATGRLSDEAMMKRLASLRLTGSPPPSTSWFDSITPGTGTAKQLMHAYQDGLLTRREYERLTRLVKVVPHGA